MQDLTTRYTMTPRRRYFFRAHWDADQEAWTCDCRLFQLRIEVEPEAPKGVVYSYQHKGGHDWAYHEVATVRQALIEAAAEAVGSERAAVVG